MIVARTSSRPMLATSVAVVTKMLEAVAGSAPKRLRANGTIAPEMPLMAQLSAAARLDVPQRDAANGDRERLAAGVARLAGEHRQERGEDDEPVEGALEKGHHAAGGERRDQVDEQPRIAELEALADGRRDPLLLLDTHHGAGLRGDLERFQFEQR